jgi:glucose/arabinose dehydrogenase
MSHPRHARAIVALAALTTLLTAAPAMAQLIAVPVASRLNRPLGLVPYPGQPNTFLVIEQAGRVRLLRDGAIDGSDFIDLRSEIASGGEQGLLGVAFAPDFTSSRRVYFSFTDRAGDSVIARFLVRPDNSLRADPGTRFDLRWPDGRRSIPQPFTNHNGGHIAFGPDGFLYFGLGDGGSGDDPGHRAQDPQSLLGKMLRIDVAVPDTHPNGYVVPPDNPFVTRAGVLGEIWAFGLRNPWRWSFDDPRRGGTGAMLIADVGQGAWEEIDYEPARSGGRNYGWRNREGAHANLTNPPPFSQPLTDPIWEYARDAGRSITGGYVYRGSALGAAFRGRYFFADFVTNRLWSLALTVNATSREARADAIIDHTADLGAAASSVTSFGVDGAGELYVVNYGGTIFRISTPGAPDPVPPGPGNPTRPRSGPPVGRARGR